RASPPGGPTTRRLLPTAADRRDVCTRLSRHVGPRLAVLPPVARLDDVPGPTPGLVINAARVLAYHPKRQQLNAAEERDHDHYRWVSERECHPRELQHQVDEC